MSYSVDYNSALGLVEFAFVGRVTGKEFREATIVGLDLARKSKTNLFLIDDSELEDAGSVGDLYELPALYQELGFERSSKGALVLPAKSAMAAQDAEFWETVCINRGWIVKSFTSREEAINWLTKEDLSKKLD